MVAGWRLARLEFREGEDLAQHLDLERGADLRVARDARPMTPPRLRTLSVSPGPTLRRHDALVAVQRVAVAERAGDDVAVVQDRSCGRARPRGGCRWTSRPGCGRRRPPPPTASMVSECRDGAVQAQVARHRGDLVEVEPHARLPPRPARASATRRRSSRSRRPRRRSRASTPRRSWHAAVISACGLRHRPRPAKAGAQRAAATSPVTRAWLLVEERLDVARQRVEELALVQQAPVEGAERVLPGRAAGR